jgi:hypothetical protein
MNKKSCCCIAMGAACLLLAYESIAAETFSFQNLDSALPPIVFEKTDAPLETKSKKLYSEASSAGNIEGLHARLKAKGFTSDVFSEDLQKNEGLPSGVSSASATFFLTHEPALNNVLFLKLDHTAKNTETDAIYDAVFGKTSVLPDGINSEHKYKHSLSLKGGFTAYLGSLVEAGFVCKDDTNIAIKWDIGKVCEKEHALDGKIVVYEAQVFYLFQSQDDFVAGITRSMKLKKK